MSPPRIIKMNFFEDSSENLCVVIALIFVMMLSYHTKLSLSIKQTKFCDIIFLDLE